VTDTFKAEIERVQRAVPAELNQDFFDKLFGEGKVSSEEEARAEIEKGIKAEFDRQADAVLYKEMQKSLMEANPMDLPEEFLQRWLNTQRDENQPEPTEADRADFILDLRWQLIKDKIAQANDLQVENEEIQQGAFNRVFQYLGPYGNEDTVRQLAGSILGNREQVQQIAREVMASKVFDVLKESFEITEKTVDKDTFKEESERILEPMRT
jgi:trigger factor